MSEEIRREFEAWALSRGLSTKKLLPVSEIYYMESMQRAWEAWQAARNFSPHSEETPWIAARTILDIADYATSHGDDLMGTGDTRDEAISDLIRKTNIKPFGS